MVALCALPALALAAQPHNGNYKAKGKGKTNILEVRSQGKAKQIQHFIFVCKAGTYNPADGSNSNLDLVSSGAHNPHIAISKTGAFSYHGSATEQATTSDGTPEPRRSVKIRLSGKFKTSSRVDGSITGDAGACRGHTPVKFTLYYYAPVTR